MVYLSFVLLIVCGILHACANVHDFRYAVVVDAGSTGNRAFLFKISVSHDHKYVELLHREMKKRGIADYVDDLPKIKDILLPLLLKVAEHIPSRIDETVLFMRATGGMRSLSEQDQSKLWKAVVDMLESDPKTPFHINPHNFGTISGKLEAYYAVIAANYVAGRVDANLMPIHGQKMIGALDMGGSSTQMIYHIGDTAHEDDFWSHSWTNFGVGSVRELVWESMAQSDNHAYVNVEIDAIGDMNEIGVVSNPCLFKGYTQVHKNVTHIGSGNATECANVVKSVLWKHHTSEDETDLRHVCHYDRLDNEIDVNLDSDAAADSLLQFNNEGLFENIMDSIHAEDAEMEVVRIEGETEEELMRYVEEQTSDSDSLLGSKSMSSSPSSFTLDNANETPHRVPCPLNNVKLHLPLSEEFYAMSVYYYAFDCVRTLGPVNVSWPTPTVLELERAVSEFCSFGDWEYIEENWIGKHENTFASQMPVRCFESTYLVTLLRYAFGFSDNFNGINYAPEVDGVTAVEWPIGFLLTHIAVDHPSLSH